MLLSMSPIALLSAGALLLASGFHLEASANEPMSLGSPAVSSEQPVAQEQRHLQASSLQMRDSASRDGDLPLEFKKPTGPRAHPLLNFKF